MKCQRLNQDGIRCKREATYVEHYHGENEIYGNNSSKLRSITWVEIYLCGLHCTNKEDSELFVRRLEKEMKSAINKSDTIEELKG